MSFKINGIDASSVFLNGQSVDSIYYNNVLVWANPNRRWPGWENAEWSDIYNLCKAKQSGEISQWPSDVVVGEKKKLISVMPDGSTYSVGSPTLVGIDIDGDGVLTFAMLDYIYNINWGVNGSGYLNNGCYLRRYAITDTYDQISPAIGSYIKPLNKQWYSITDYDTTQNKMSIAENETVWVFSAAEAGLSISTGQSEYTVGVNQPYQYFQEKPQMISGWLRSSSGLYKAYYASGGVAIDESKSETLYPALGFAIG